VTARLAGGGTLDADLLVGADGIHSTVRDRVFGPAAGHLRQLGFHTAAYLFRDPEVHAAVDGEFCLTDTVDRQLGCYGIGGDQVATAWPATSGRCARSSPPGSAPRAAPPAGSCRRAPASCASAGPRSSRAGCRWWTGGSPASRPR
jgi:2-polyprenyl-6-methoxyphenol hydroxylase-like FAD-dependent oxidoreductase